MKKIVLQYTLLSEGLNNKYIYYQITIHCHLPVHIIIHVHIIILQNINLGPLIIIHLHIIIPA